MRKDFDAGKAFLTCAACQRQDSDQSNLVKHIYMNDLVTLMKKHNKFDSLEPMDLALLMSRFDRDGDGRISLNEWFEQIQP